jgi:Mg-chelatase subunit ChlI
VNIPLNISEENLFGKIDIENLLKKGERKFVPGLLAKAHRQILYIDEVNLIPDHITDSLLDVSASGYNKVEREGCSVVHKSDFLLIGTMNKEEGELRPQILDRFPLSITVSTVTDTEERKEIIRRNFAFENDPELFCKQFHDVHESMKYTILKAREIYPETSLDESDIHHIIEFLIEQKVDGHRSELVIFKTARAYAALEFKQKVEHKHLITAMKLSLLHRTREGGLKKPVTAEDIDTWFAKDKSKIQSKDFDLKIHPENISLFKGGFVSPAKK